MNAINICIGLSVILIFASLYLLMNNKKLKDANARLQSLANIWQNKARKEQKQAHLKWVENVSAMFDYWAFQPHTACDSFRFNYDKETCIISGTMHFESYKVDIDAQLLVSDPYSAFYKGTTELSNKKFLKDVFEDNPEDDFWTDYGEDN